MLRQSDVELLALALGAGIAVAGAVSLQRRRLGPVVVAAALGLAVWADDAVTHAVPGDALAEARSWVAVVMVVAVAAAVAWGAGRLPIAAVVGGQPPALPLAVASLVGVWAGVPETSVALLAAGVLVGIGVVLWAGHRTLSRAGSVMAAIVPVGAAYLGAVGNRHALLGGLLCSATFVVLAFGPRIRSVSPAALARGGAVHLGSALAAARLIGVSRAWSVAPLWMAVVVVLAVASARLLRSDAAQGAP